MIIQEIINGTPTVKQIADAIGVYKASQDTRLLRLNNLFKAKDDAVTTYYNSGVNETVNKLNFPIAKYISLISTSFIIGKQPTYKAVQAADNSAFIDEQLKEVGNLYRRQSIGRHDLSLRLQASKTGFAYEYVYIDKKTLLPKVKKLSEYTTVVVFDNTIDENSIYGVYWSEFEDLYTVTVATETEIIEYLTNSPTDATAYVERRRYFHYIGRVPITLVKNNEDMIGDYENVAGLIEAFNDISTDEKYDIKKTVNAILAFFNTKLAGATPEEKIKLRNAIKTLGMMEITPDNKQQAADVKPLSNPLNLTDTETFVNRLWTAIFQLALVPDPSRTEFYTAISGVALDMQLFMGLNQLATICEPEFEYSLRRRLKMEAQLLTLRGIVKPFDTSDVEIIFNHTRPENLTEKAQLIGTLSATGKYSDKYITELMSGVKYEDMQTDIEKERKEKAKQTLTNPDINSTTPTWFNSAMGGLSAAGGNNGGEN